MDLRAGRPVTLRTARLLLRPVARGDAPAITAALQDWEVVRWLTSVPWPYGLEDALWFIGEAEAGRMAPLAITRDGTFLGVIATDGELGYWLSRAHWGQGYMPEAAEAVVAAVFADTDEDSLSAGYLDGNARSGAVLRGLGFQETGHGTRESKALRRAVPSVEMALTRADWQARRAGP